MGKLLYSMLVVPLIILFSCKNNEEKYSVLTGDVTDMDKTVAFSCEIIATDIMNVREFGFIWSSDSGLNDSISTDHNIVNGLNTITTSNHFLLGCNYQVRAFIKVNNEYRFGESITFTGTYNPKTSISRIVPEEGTWWDNLQIYGKNFNNPENPVLSLFIGDIMVNYQIINDSIIKTSIPDLFSDEFPILLITQSDTSIAPVKFKLLPPEISGYNPESGERGTILVVNGKNFYPMKGHDTVKLGTTELEILDCDHNKITCIIPESMTVSGLYDLSVKSGNRTVFSPVKYQHYEKWSYLGHQSRYEYHSIPTKIDYFVIADKYYSFEVNNFDERRGTFYDCVYEIDPLNNNKSIIYSWYDTRVIASFFIDSNQLYFIISSGVYQPGNGEVYLKSTLPVLGPDWKVMTINNNGYLMTSGRFYKYDNTLNRWIEKTPPPEGRVMRSMSISNFGLILLQLSDPYFDSYNLYKYSVENDQWTLLKHYTKDDSYDNSRANSELYYTLRGDWKGYNSRGYSLFSDGVIGVLYIYDPETNTWTRKPGPYNNLGIGPIRYGFGNYLYAEFYKDSGMQPIYNLLNIYIYLWRYEL